MTRRRILERLDAAWQAFTSSYAGMSNVELLEPGVTGTWSVRDIIAHVTTWEEEALTHLPHVHAGRRPPMYSVRYGGIAGFNAFATERKKRLTLAEVFAEQEATHQRLLQYLESVPEDLFTSGTRFRHRLRLDTYSHYPKHAEAIRRWRLSREAADTAGR